MDDRGLDGTILRAHGLVDGKSAGEGLWILWVPGQAAEENSECMGIGLQATLL